MRVLSLNEAIIERWCQEFRSQLMGVTNAATRSTVEFKRDITTKKPGAITIRFTTEAYMKMWTLVTSFSSEIGWHGLVRRIDKTTFEIYDILVYPQVVTAATVNTDQQKYQQWLMDPDEHPDEVFNAIRMQGHSHVNMSVSPSGTDLSNQERTIEVLGEDDYYIFLIWNKRNERSCRVYDMADNVMYDENDTVFEIAGMNDFRSLAESMLERVAPVAPAATTYGANTSGYWVGGQYVPNRPAGAVQQYSPPAQTPAAPAAAPAQTPAKPTWTQGQTSPVNSAAQVTVVPIDDDDEDEYTGGLYSYYQRNAASLNAYGNRSCMPYGYGGYYDD